MKNIQLICTRTISRDESLFCRANIDEGTVNEYADQYAAGVEFPPLKCVKVGRVRYVVDGFLRLEAARRIALQKIPVEDIGTCTLQDAQWLAVTMNATHGLRRTNADKQRCVELSLQHPKGVGMSNRMIASHCCVSPVTVGTARRRLERAGKIEPVKLRVGKNGRTYLRERFPAVVKQAERRDDGRSQGKTPGKTPGKIQDSPCRTQQKRDMRLPNAIASLDEAFSEAIDKYGDCERVIASVAIDSEVLGRVASLCTRLVTCALTATKERRNVTES